MFERREWHGKRDKTGRPGPIKCPSTYGMAQRDLTAKMFDSLEQIKKQVRIVSVGGPRVLRDRWSFIFFSFSIYLT